MRKLIFLMPFLCWACATIPAEAEASKSFRYVSVNPGPGIAYVINPDEARLSPVMEGALDTVPISITICENRSEFMCFYGSQITFGVPRSGLEKASTWEIDRHSFRVVRQLSTPNCGENFVLESSQNGRPVGVFLFNYQLGLQTMMFVESVETIALEEVSGDAYLFGGIFQVDGLGFGGSGSCEE